MKDYDKIIKTQKQKIEEFIKSPFYSEFLTENEMAEALQVPDDDMLLYRFIISELIKEGKLIVTKKQRLAPPEKAGLFTGTLRTVESGKGFVTCQGLETEIYIPKSSLNGAAHKDTVLVAASLSKGVLTGTVKKVIKRGIDKVVGTYEIRDKTGFVYPDDKRLFKRIVIAGRARGELEGFKVVTKIIEAPNKQRIPKGKLCDVLGLKGTKGVDMLSLMAENGIVQDFPSKVKAEIGKIPMTVSSKDIKGREDFRHVQTVTVDGEDAKDLDDAVSCRALENGSYELGVYIADVSHYVKAGTAIDGEAYKRGTSTYLPDRVIPMLPKELSNGICSLNAGEDRLALCCIMEIDKDGRVVAHRTVKGVINVNHRMTYTVVNDLLENEASQYKDEYKDLLPMLRLMKELKEKLFKKREGRGAISFSFTEAKVVLDNEGRAVAIEERPRNTATDIIEEFMIAANETVAEEFFSLKIPFIYRSHEMPDEEKYEMLSKTVGKMGFVLKADRNNPKSLQELLAKVKGNPEEMMVNMLALRSMRQARYTKEELGHFGLGAKFYCHFTSPIRRYPDLFIHRIISLYLNGRTPEALNAVFSKNLDAIADLCSENERKAEAAERDATEMKKAEYMADKIGQTFDGAVDSVTSWGIYVRLPNTVVGMVSYADMNDDRYIYDVDSMSCMGERTHKTYSIGDEVRVVLQRVDVEMRHIDFMFEGTAQSAEKPKAFKTPKKPKAKRKTKARRTKRHR